MDKSQQKALFDKLENTIAEWATQDGDEHRGLTDQASRMKEVLETLIAGTARYREGAAELAQRLRGELRELKDALESGEDAEKRITELEADLAKARESAQAAEEQAARLQQTLAESSEAAQAAQQRVGKLERELAKAQEEAAGLNQRVPELEKTEAALRAQMDDLGSQLDKARADEQALSLDLEVTMSDLAALRAEKESLGDAAGKLEDLEKELDAERKRAEKLEKDLHEEKTKKAKSALAEQLADALRESEVAQEEVSSLRAELDRLRATQDTNDAPAEDSGKASGRKKKHAKDRNDQKRDFGEILVESGVITREQLATALEIQRKSPQRHLGAILVEKRLASEDAVGKAIARACDVPFVRLDHEQPAPEAAGLLSARLAKLHTCMPVRTKGNTLVLAMANPLDLVAIEDIERTTNLTVTPVVATASEIAGAIKEFYKRD